LHKVNGVVIEVPSEKMSAEDMRYVETLANKRSLKSSSENHGSDDDEPLASRRLSLREGVKPPPKKGSKTDWFEFFLNAGCDLDDCTRYATSFERDKIDESILPDITEGTMRSLGLREGDIIRVRKEIDKRKPKDAQERPIVELDKQADVTAGRSSPTKRNTVSPAPNLFAGPNGALKISTQRRGRPQPSKTLPPTNVDITAISSVTDQMQRASTASPVQAPPRTSSASLLVSSGFDDDAWTNRPSSTKPLTPTPPAHVALRAPSAPPTVASHAVRALSPPTAPSQSLPTSSQAQPASTDLALPTVHALSQSITPSQSLPTPSQSQPAIKSLASTTENDVFEQLARLSQLRVQTPAVSPPTAPLPNNNIPPIVSPPPRSFASGMGIGASPVPMGRIQTPSAAPMQQPQMTNVPRGPFAPVPANQSLLQPLIPTTTGFNSFVPTRPVSNNGSQLQQPQQSFLSSQPTGFLGPAMSNPTGFLPSFRSPGPQSQTSGFQPTGLQPQPTGFQPSFQTSGPQSQMHGFQPSGMQSQPTGFTPSVGMMSQPTGALGGINFGNMALPPPNSDLGQIRSSAFLLV
jgi:actin cytoskeleton-regulatory complex protein SLA1